jgi:phage baseplate assembly protein gpV
MVGDDGSQFEYNPDKGMLHIGGIKDLQLIGGGAINITKGGPINMTAGANVFVKGANATIQGGTITLDGNVQISGTLTVKGFCDFQAGGQANPHIVNQDGSGGGTLLAQQSLEEEVRQLRDRVDALERRGT